jgi:hypothetical protein
MDINYYQLGPGKRLNEIVMAGSHDAGITKGLGYAKTQSNGIYDQALAGVRVFDIRVSGQLGIFQNKVTLATYHCEKPNNVPVSMKVKHLYRPKQEVVKSDLGGGVWGQKLKDILDDAAAFVHQNRTEFLILKFDKCSNWEQIAEMCVLELHHRLYKGAGNLNLKTLDDLKGKVVVVFEDAAWHTIRNKYRGRNGILAFKNLHGTGAYDENYNGIQYFGKGGTSIWTPRSKCIDENYSKQFDLMLEPALHHNPNVMGMMYWTTTGALGNIRKRNKMMWKTPQVERLQRLWASGVDDMVVQRIPAGGLGLKVDRYWTVKKFLPNIIMVDFADKTKCETIYSLNYVNPAQYLDDERSHAAH